MFAQLVSLCVAAAVLVAVAEAKRVQYFDVPCGTREEACEYCQSQWNAHIAFTSQIAADIKDGIAEHRHCGWTWERRGPLIHICTAKDGKSCDYNANSFVDCQPDSAERKSTDKYGVYCEVNSVDIELPRFKLQHGFLTTLFEMSGKGGKNSIKSMEEARAVCESEGAILAYWSQVANYIERYNFQVPEYVCLNEQYAVYRANCNGNQKIEWQIWDDDRGYDALCYGNRPHKYSNPCNAPYPTLLGQPVYCFDDLIVIQSRPRCGEELYRFNNKNFYSFKTGFGKHGLGYWLGLETVSILTRNYRFGLRIVLELSTGKNVTANYDSVVVGPENKDDKNQYVLTVKGYKGDAGDMLNEPCADGTTTNGSPFSAPNRDNDCDPNFDHASEFKSGWWFSSCMMSNINGMCSNEQGYDEGRLKMRSWSCFTNKGDSSKKIYIVRTWVFIIYKGDDAVDVAFDIPS